MISLVSIFAFAQASFAAPVEHETLLIDDARVRMIHGNTPATAAYASITNKGDRLTVWCRLQPISPGNPKFM